MDRRVTSFTWGKKNENSKYSTKKLRYKICVASCQSLAYHADVRIA